MKKLIILLAILFMGCDQEKVTSHHVGVVTGKDIIIGRSCNFLVVHFNEGSHLFRTIYTSEGYLHDSDIKDLHEFHKMEVGKTYMVLFSGEKIVSMIERKEANK